MDRLGATHLRAIQQEREQTLEKRYQQYLASQSQHSQQQRSARVFLRGSGVSLLLVFTICVILFIVR
jgi:hypothetical protein